ncbi:S-type anion channel slah3 [Thalictrum thalictroides]|uniref:S-type anion channel slah3 n=1 Tax=Thalictrum thalictroides TaxID=46969 RepID=A0A7J6WZS5_THATH|nr:S-type anion channel slah3 [Thalictrum thalictroides]
METIEDLASNKQVSLEELPSLFKYAASKAIDGFDDVEVTGSVNHQCQPTCPTSFGSPDFTTVKVIDSATYPNQAAASQINDFHHGNTISISMPSSPLGRKKVIFTDEVALNVNNGIPDPHAVSMVSNHVKPKQSKSYSQPMPNMDADGKFIESTLLQKNPRIDRLKDKRFDSFKTWSGKLERQISNLRGKPQDTEQEAHTLRSSGIDHLPVDRYFAALEGPELDTLRASEELVLPEDKQWPFLLRYPISAFGICLGTSSQAILWKTIATSTSTNFLHINIDVNFVLWCISVVLTIVVTFIYSLKVILYFEAIKREYYHPIRINFFFAPWIAFLFLALGVPPSLVKYLHTSFWYILMTPIFCLELKIYGQWMSGGRRRLSKVANPSNHLSIVGNFVGALLGASMGLKEGPIFFFAVGLAHYIVLFVTLYQRLPTNETLPKELHPVFFLFVAAPSVASMAWARIQGTFDYGSRICYFIALFLYFSLAVRVNFFRGFKFSLGWWAYTFPMTGAAIATIRYSNEVKNPVTQSLAVVLSAISTLTVTSLLVSTIIHAFVLRDLFPNDIAIAISRRKIKDKKHVHLRSACSDTKAMDDSKVDKLSLITKLPLPN